MSYLGSADQLYFSGVLKKNEKMFEGSLERQKRKPSRKFSQQKDLNFQGKKTNRNSQEKIEKINDVNLHFPRRLWHFSERKNIYRKIKTIFYFQRSKKNNYEFSVISKQKLKQL